MNWINISVSIGLALLMLTFSFENMMPVHLSFLNFESDEMPLFLPVVMSFLLGFASGLLALSFSRRKHKKEIKYLRKENALLNQEVENLRNIPLQDDL